jgi:parallel beta-helix repeat protein
LQNSVSSTTTCFNITAENVTLDCGSYSNEVIYGNQNFAANYYGVYSNKNNTKIRNCKIKRGSNSLSTQNRYGIYFKGSNFSIIENANVSDNRYGIYSDTGSYNNLTNIS